ncbi:MAG: hypothetical protein MI724_13485 [Spirochaetales bacterium]|nr:hypothetical protein [Spirochaetales bacterium]
MIQNEGLRDSGREEIVRVEVIANRSIQEDFFEALSRRGVGLHHTLISEAQGVGHAGPRRGDHIWPEENFLYIAYVSTDDARIIREETETLRRRFPDEGIRFFATRGIAV